MCVLSCVCVSEISRVRKDMYIDTLNGSERIGELPDAVGPHIQLQEKLYVPTKEHPDVSRFPSVCVSVFIRTLSVGHVIESV